MPDIGHNKAEPTKIPALCEAMWDYLGFDYNLFNLWVSKNITHWFRKNLSSMCTIWII